MYAEPISLARGLRSGVFGVVRSNMNENFPNHYRCEALVGCRVLVRWLMGVRRAFEAGCGEGVRRGGALRKGIARSEALASV